MAKRSNKTAHVLNLLSGSGDAVSEAPEQKKAEAASAPETVSVVSPSDESTKLADGIKAVLEQELLQDEAVKPSAPTVQESVVKAPVEQVQESPAVAPVVQVQASPAAAPVQKEEELKYDAVTTPEVREAIESEHEFKFVSVMEELVTEAVGEYLTRFGCCTCSRCVADVVALALTNLPAKYVVSGNKDVSPLLNYYSKKYEGQVTVEITKACMKVASYPHHP